MRIRLEGVPHRYQGFRMRRQQRKNNGKNRENTGMAADESQKHKWGGSLKQGIRAEKFVSPH